MIDKILVVKAKGGMGNRMLCAATGILYGHLTNRTVAIDWRDGVYANRTENAFFLYFDCPSIIPMSDSLVSVQSVAPDIWEGNLNRTVSSLISQNDPDMHSSKFIHRKYSIDVRIKDYPNNIIVFWNYIDRINNLRRHLILKECPYFGLDRKEILKKILTEKMRLKECINDKIYDFKAKHWDDFVIGVHVRHTDRKIALDKYEKPINKLITKYPGASIFLATDSQRVSLHFTNKYERVISTPKWYPEDEGALHSSRDCPDRYQSGIEALLDMYLLAECHGLVFPGNSTFSWISSVLTEASPENVFDVERWNGKVLLAKFLRESIP